MEEHIRVVFTDGSQISGRMGLSYRNNSCPFFSLKNPDTGETVIFKSAVKLIHPVKEDDDDKPVVTVISLEN